jgi:type I restriction enzyme S subunit
MAVAGEVAQRNEGLVSTNLLSLSYGRIVLKDITSNDGLLPESFETYQVLEPDDIVLRLTDLQNDKRSLRTARCAHAGIITSAYLALRPRGIESRFLAHLLHSYDVMKVFYSMGGGLRQTMNFADVRRLPVLVPPRDEQLSIATFLDRETGKIDALVAEQERLIALLKEKRQAVISHAVTKGLDPNAPMKDSGVEWLGPVPAHWRVGKLGHAGRLKGGFAFSSADFSSEGTAVVRMNNLKRGRLDLSDAVRIPDAACNENVALSDGDLVWGMSGSIGETGSLGNYARVKRDDLPAQLNQRVGRFELAPSLLLADFLEQVVQARYFAEQIVLLVTGTAQFNVSSEQVEACIVALPPVLEQRDIVGRIQHAAGKFADLTSQAETVIALLKERRAALISAAVTGKIDVRGLVTPEEAQAA